MRAGGLGLRALLLEKEEESAKQRYQRAKSTCEELIEQLDPREAD